MMRTARMFAFALAMAIAVGASAQQDALLMTSASADTGDAVLLDVFLRDSTGTPLGSDAGAGKRIQAFAFRVTFPPAAVSSVSFVRAGVLAGLTPIYERSAYGAGVFGYLATFDEASTPVPLTPGSNGGDPIGTLHVQLSSAAGGELPFTIDPIATALSNQNATVRETVYQHTLALSSGSINVRTWGTSTVLATSAAQAQIDQSVTFTATVSSPAAAIPPAGTVTFLDGTAILGTGTVSGGQATLTTSSLEDGLHRIKARYEGDGPHTKSESTYLLQSVKTSASLAAPAGFVATTYSYSYASLTWMSVSGATTYQVYRASNETPLTPIAITSATYYNDFSSLTADTTYVYAVRALGESGSSGASNWDTATTTAFSDDLSYGHSVPIRAAHINELRKAVNAMRRTAGLPPATFTDPTVIGGVTPIRSLHLAEIATRLAEAAAVFGMTPPGNGFDPVVRSEHVQRFRNFVK